MFEREDYVEGLESIRKSKVTIAEALKELDVVKTAFRRVNDLEKRQQSQEEQLIELRALIAQSVPSALFTQRLEEYTTALDRKLRVKEENFIQKVFAELESKLSIREFETLFKQKANWSQFTGLAHQVDSLKADLDKHIATEFNGFKTKMKIELNRFREEAEDRQYEKLQQEEFKKLHEKVHVLETQVKEMIWANDEMLQPDEDYDSQEELDSIHGDDLSRAVFKEQNKEELVDNGQEIQTAPEVRKGYSRHMSKASSAEHSVVGGSILRQINKKTAQLRLDLTEIKKEIDAHSQNHVVLKSELAQLDNFGVTLNRKVDQVLELQNSMEDQFIKALKRKGINTTPKAPEPKPLFKPLTTDIQKLLDEKTQRILSLESLTQNLSNETSLLKNLHREKFNEIIQALHHLNEARAHFSTELTKAQAAHKTSFKFLKQELSDVRREMKHLKGPLTNLISNQHRENQVLTEDIKRQQHVFRNLFEDYANVLDSQRPGVSRERSPSVESTQRVCGSLRDSGRLKTASPTVTLKQRFTANNVSGRAYSPITVEDKWALPEGQFLPLPRMKSKDPPHRNTLSLVCYEMPTPKDR